MINWKCQVKFDQLIVFHSCHSGNRWHATPWLSSPFCFYIIASITYIHLVHCAGVWTQDLLIMSHLPLLPDHGSSPCKLIFRFRSCCCNSCHSGNRWHDTPWLSSPICVGPSILVLHQRWEDWPYSVCRKGCKSY